ncbi:MAG: hypothetical protein Q8M83_04360, partial [bacterium]|nr:hypothetical protein [bacterium]
MSTPDCKMIAAHALSHIEAICTRWLSDGKKAGHEWEIGDRHGTPGKSLKVHLSGSKAGMWADFSTGDKGGDLVSLVAFVEGTAQGDAARKLADFLGLPKAKHWVLWADSKRTPRGQKKEFTWQVYAEADGRREWRWQ